MPTRIRLENRVSAKAELRTTIIKIAISGLGLSSVVFVGVLLFNYLGIHSNSQAAEKTENKYPFDIHAEAMEKINFQVLPNMINTGYEEVRPMITGNGSTLFFCRRHHPDNYLRKKDEQDIWTSSRKP